MNVSFVTVKTAFVTITKNVNMYPANITSRNSRAQDLISTPDRSSDLFRIKARIAENCIE